MRIVLTVVVIYVVNKENKLVAKKKNEFYKPLTDFKIEVIRINKDKTEIVKKEMLMSEWLLMKRQKNYEYKAYQIGYSSYNLTK